MSLILVDPLYNTQLLDDTQINSSTRLAPSVTIAKFLGAGGDRTHFNHISNIDTRRQIARNLSLHAEALRAINGQTELFNDVTINVVEGLYNAEGGEITSGDVAKQKKLGQLIHYEVVGRDGKIDLEKTFDVAEYWKDYIQYGELHLSYDTLNPDNSLYASIGLLMPTVSETYEVRFTRTVKTFYNGHLQSNGELVEILESDD